ARDRHRGDAAARQATTDLVARPAGGVPPGLSRRGPAPTGLGYHGPAVAAAAALTVARRPLRSLLAMTDTASPADAPALAMVGLGRMGANMARRLAAGGAIVHGHDPSDAARAGVANTHADTRRAP